MPLCKKWAENVTSIEGQYFVTTLKGLLKLLSFWVALIQTGLRQRTKETDLDVIADTTDQTKRDRDMVARENSLALHDLYRRELDLYNGCPVAATTRKEEPLRIRASL